MREPATTDDAPTADFPTRHTARWISVICGERRFEVAIDQLGQT
jgi:hypothetical protein